MYNVSQFGNIWYIKNSSDSQLTLPSPVMSNGYKCSGPYWSNPPFLICWHLRTLTCPNVKKLKRVG